MSTTVVWELWLTVSTEASGVQDQEEGKKKGGAYFGGLRIHLHRLIIIIEK